MQIHERGLVFVLQAALIAMNQLCPPLSVVRKREPHTYARSGHASIDERSHVLATLTRGELRALRKGRQRSNRPAGGQGRRRDGWRVLGPENAFQNVQWRVLGPENAFQNVRLRMHQIINLRHQKWAAFRRVRRLKLPLRDHFGCCQQGEESLLRRGVVQSHPTVMGSCYGIRVMPRHGGHATEMVLPRDGCHVTVNRLMPR